MDPKLRELVARTNLDELVRPAETSLDYRQPVEAAPPPKIDPPRSTTDPLQIHFATVDVIEKLDTGRVSTPLKLVGLLLVGGPIMFFGASIIFTAWYDASTGQFAHPADPRDLGRAVFRTVFGALFIFLLPVALFLSGRSRASS